MYIRVQAGALAGKRFAAINDTQGAQSTRLYGIHLYK